MCTYVCVYVCTCTTSGETDIVYDIIELRAEASAPTSCSLFLGLSF